MLNKIFYASYIYTETSQIPSTYSDDFFRILNIITLVLLIIIWKGKEMFYLTTHSTHFIYGYMVSDIW